MSFFFLPKVKHGLFLSQFMQYRLKTRKRGLKAQRGYQWINIKVGLFGQVAKNKKCLNHIKSCIFTYNAKQKSQAKHLSINKHDQVTQEKYRNGAWRSILYIKAQDSQGQTLSQKI